MIFNHPARSFKIVLSTDDFNSEFKDEWLLKNLLGDDQKCPANIKNVQTSINFVGKCPTTILSTVVYLIVKFLLIILYNAVFIVV